MEEIGCDIVTAFRTRGRATPHTNNFMVDIHEYWLQETCSNNLDHSRIACSDWSNMTGKPESRPHRPNTPLFLSRHLSSNYVLTRNSTMDCNMPPTANEESCSSRRCANFSNLPLDVILAIAECLPASSVTCLALTCKQLYYCEPLYTIYTKNLDPSASPDRCPNLGDKCYPGTEKHNHDHLDFVRTRRRDLPEHLLCEFCQEFHPKPMPKSSRLGADWISCPAAPQSAMWIRWPKHRVHLQFEDVQMVMNQHRWGGSHGAPLSSISIDTDWEVVRLRYGCEILGKFSLEPEIVDGNLLIHTREHVFFTARQFQEKYRDCFVEPLQNVSMDMFGPCRHYSPRWHLGKSIRWLLRECKYRATRRWPVTNPGHAREPDWDKSEMIQCAQCSTCSCVEMAYHNDNFRLRGSVDRKLRTPVQGVELILHSWMYLGDCQYAFSPSWLNVCLSRGNSYPEYIYQKAKDLDETYRNDRLREARMRYEEITSSSSTLGRPSLLPSVKCAATMGSHEPRRDELEHIFWDYDFKCSDVCKEILVEEELSRPIVRDYFVSQADFESLQRAREIIREYRQYTTPRWLLKAWLCFEFFDKLTSGLLTGKSSVDPDEVYQKVHVWPWDKPR